MDSLPSELKLELLETIARTDLRALLALSSVNRAFHALYTPLEHQLLRSFTESFIPYEFAELVWYTALFPRKEALVLPEDELVECSCCNEDEDERFEKLFEYFQKHEEGAKYKNLEERAREILSTVSPSHLKAMIRQHATAIALDSLQRNAVFLIPSGVEINPDYYMRLCYETTAYYTSANQNPKANLLYLYIPSFYGQRDWISGGLIVGEFDCLFESMVERAYTALHSPDNASDIWGNDEGYEFAGRLLECLAQLSGVTHSDLNDGKVYRAQLKAWLKGRELYYDMKHSHGYQWFEEFADGNRFASEVLMNDWFHTARGFCKGEERSRRELAWAVVFCVHQRLIWPDCVEIL